MSRLPGERSTDRNGMSSCHGRVTSPQAVFAHRLASLAVWAVSSKEIVARLSTTAAVEKTLSSGGHHLQAGTILAPAPPTVGAQRTSAPTPPGAAAARPV